MPTDDPRTAYAELSPGVFALRPVPVAGARTYAPYWASLGPRLPGGAQVLGWSEVVEGDARTLDSTSCATPTSDAPSEVDAVPAGQPTDRSPDDATSSDSTPSASTPADVVPVDVVSARAPSGEASVATACERDATSTDATSTDATSTDATSTDATSTDATSTDATSTDATSTDGTSTGGTSTDASAADSTLAGGGLLVLGVGRDAAHGRALDDLRAVLVVEAQQFASRVDVLLSLAAWQGQAAVDGVHQAWQLEWAGTCGISQLTAATWAADADRYSTCLPVTLSMLRAGTILLPQARVLLTRTRHCSPRIAAAVEAEVLPGKAHWCPSDLRKAVDKVVLRLLSEQTDPAVAEQQHADTVAGRRTFTRPDSDGMGLAGAVLPAEQLTAWQRGLDALELRERAADRVAGIDRTVDQRKADLFAALPALVLAGTAQDRASRPDLTSSPLSGPVGGEPVLPLVGLAPWSFTTAQLCAQVVLNVLVPVATVLDLSAEPGTLVGFGPVSAEHVRLVRPHSYRKILVDTTSGMPMAVDDHPSPLPDDPGARRELYRDLLQPTVIVDRDEAQHDPSARLARLVDVRDAHCCGPGCSSSRTDRDHREPWPSGPTSARNLGRLSRRCHLAKHHGWGLQRHPDGTSTWASPLRRTYTRPAPHSPPPKVDLHQPSPPLRPPPTGKDRWVIGLPARPKPPEQAKPIPPPLPDEPPF